MNEQEKAMRTLIEGALEKEEIPRIYFNGFISALGSGDVLIVLQQYNRPVAVLSSSYTVAKTLAEKLGLAISDFEETCDQVVMTTEDMAKLVSEGR